jgi:hypothetical protein
MCPIFAQNAVSNKPKSSVSTHNLTLHTSRSSKKVAEVVSKARPDLASAAAMRYKRTSRDARIRRGASKKVLKSTRRGKH